jgi:7,8-dihydropterin-6-yl-methyl-4-(beta-D-ribofuranosyl)aminobenzene 5'-phosphate synthase
MFVTRAIRTPKGEFLPFEDVTKPAALAKLGASVVNSGEARLIMDEMFYLSGEIPRVTAYERGFPAHVRLAADGSSWEPDPLLRDERYVAAHVQGKGVVVFTACSHAGVVNVLTDARHVFGDVPLFGVMGGFHLAGPEVETIIPDTVRDLGGFPLKRIVPCHCTGWRAVHALANAYNDDVLVPAAVGRQFRF